MVPPAGETPKDQYRPSGTRDLLRLEMPVNMSSAANHFTRNKMLGSVTGLGESGEWSRGRVPMARVRSCSAPRRWVVHPRTLPDMRMSCVQRASTVEMVGKVVAVWGSFIAVWRPVSALRE